MDDFLPYYKFAKNQAHKISNNRELAEDIVQDVFLKLYRKNISLIGHKNLKGYLTIAIRNQYLDHYSKSKKMKFNDIEDYSNDFFVNPHGELLSDDLKTAIGCMPETLSQPLILHAIYGYLDPEVASILDIPIGTVKNRLFRAKAFLREKLAYSNCST